MINQNTVRIPYAIDHNGNCVSAGQVPNGKACGCTCPSCGTSVMAIQGDKRRYHFRHIESPEKHGNNTCIDPEIMSVHKMSEQIIKAASQIWVPAQHYSPGNRHKDIVFHDATRVRISNCKLEPFYHDIIPDIEIENDGFHFFVEIYVSHKVDDVKVEKLHKRGIPTLEIDLHDLDLLVENSERLLSEILLCESERKTWRYLPESYELERIVKTQADRLEYRNSQDPYYNVERCPKNLGCHDELDYSSFEECGHCQYCLDIKERDYFSGIITCSGRADFTINEKHQVEYGNHSIISSEREKRKQKKAEEQAKRDALIKEKEAAEIAKGQRLREENEKREAELRLPMVITTNCFDPILRTFYKLISLREILPWFKFNISEEKYYKIVGNYDKNQQSMIYTIDSYGREWFRCEICNKYGPDDVFGTTQLGGQSVHKESYSPKCADEWHRRRVKVVEEERKNNLQKKAERKCPYCDSKLIIKMGKFGKFYGCQAYPNCRYTESV